MTNRLINRNTKTITFSLPPETIRYERLRARHAEQGDSRRTE